MSVTNIIQPGPEPEYIEESAEFSLLRKVYTHETLNIQKGHVSLGYTLLKHSLYIIYGSTNIEKFITETSKLYTLSERFSQTMKDVAAVNQWSKSTTTVAFSSLKKILSDTQISSSFLQRIIIPHDKKLSKKSDAFCLPRKYKLLPDDDPNKQTLITLVQECREKSRYKAQDSITAWISFICQFLDNLNLEPQHFKNAKDCSFNTISDTIKDTRPNLNYSRKVQFTSILICNILGNGEWIDKFNLLKKTSTKNKPFESDTDKHRISTDELEVMYDASKDKLIDETLFLLMITTGLRATGVSHIKLEHVVTTINDKTIVKQTGRTLEKGNKWFTFVINKKVHSLLERWIDEGRKSRGSYLFPGRGEDIGVCPHRINSIIKGIAKRAGLEGPHIHAHSLRHTFAHILLEEGNKPELVAKMLGHSSAATTEKYYLKESASEVSNRLNIPWISKEKAKSTVPSFMKEDKQKPKEKKNKITKVEKQKMFQQLKMGMSNLTNVQE